MRRRPVLIALWLASLCWFLAMAGFVEWRLAPQGATPLPDVSLTGHDAERLVAWMAGMTDRGRALVLGPFRVLDTVFPLLLALTLVITGAARHVWLGLAGLAYAGADLAENAVIAAMLRAWPAAPGADAVALASALTIAKWVMVIPAVALGLWLFWKEVKGQPCSLP
ncbi:MAG: hypothetical protein ACXIVG_13530 [Pararhodobacter sp.]